MDILCLRNSRCHQEVFRNIRPRAQVRNIQILQRRNRLRASPVVSHLLCKDRACFIRIQGALQQRVPLPIAIVVLRCNTPLNAPRPLHDVIVLSTKSHISQYTHRTLKNLIMIRIVENHVATHNGRTTQNMLVIQEIEAPLRSIVANRIRDVDVLEYIDGIRSPDLVLHQGIPASLVLLMGRRPCKLQRLYFSFSESERRNKANEQYCQTLQIFHFLHHTEKWLTPTHFTPTPKILKNYYIPRLFSKKRGKISQFFEFYLLV